MRTDRPPIIVGIDLAKDTFVAAILNTLGQLLATETFACDGEGLQSFCSWLDEYGDFPDEP